LNAAQLAWTLLMRIFFSMRMRNISWNYKFFLQFSYLQRANEKNLGKEKLVELEIFFS